MKYAISIIATGLMVLILSRALPIAQTPARWDEPAATMQAAINSASVYLPLVTKSGLPPVNQNSFLETFDGMPASPQPWKPLNWDVTVHTRVADAVDTLPSMQADHGPGCEAPPATHFTNTFEGAVYTCRNHMMTAINDDEYGVIYLTPDHMVDFSSGEAVIKFDVSTRRTSGRDWIDVWVTPFADNLQLPLDSWLPDLNGPPRQAVHIRMDFPDKNTIFLAEVVRNFDEQPVPQKSTAGYETFLTPSAMQRDTFELDISKNHIRFGMPQYNFWWVDADIPTLDWSQGVVQLGHHSYNPEKDCNYDGTCGPNTWHWDNVSITPAVPFTILRADQRYLNGDTNPQVNLPAPVPANSFLRFDGIGANLQVSFDGGSSWAPAQIQAQIEQIDGHFQSYWMPMPAGVSQVLLRGQDWWGGGWMIRDISAWSLTLLHDF